MRLAVLALIAACGSTTTSTGQGRYGGVAAAIGRGEVPKTTSVLVMQHGQVEYEGYFGGADAGTLHDTRSAMKTVTALAVGIAIDRGLIKGVGEPALAYLADLRPFAHDTKEKAEITIGDLLTTSSALDCDDNDDKSPGNEDNMHPQPGWARWGVDLPTRADYQRDADGRGPWRYCTIHSFLLGQIVQRVAKQPVDAFIAKQLFEPLGIGAWEFPYSPTHEAMTGGGLRLSTRDLGKLGQLIRQRGMWQGKQVVSSGWIDEMTKVRRHAFPELKMDYGYLIWNHAFKMPCGTVNGWYMSGNGGNQVLVLDELDAVVVVTRTAYNTHGMHPQTIKLIQEDILPSLSTCKH